MVLKSKIIRVSEDFSKVEAETAVNTFLMYKDFLPFQIGELYLGVFCIENYQGYKKDRINDQAALYVYEISTLMLKT